jgi:chitinase
MPYEWNDEDSEWSKGLYHRTLQLKQTNPDLKVLIGVGGWNHGPEEFSKMVHSSYLRKSFSRKTIAFMKKHKFDGLDVDWEYPGSRNGSQPTDKQHFTTLLKELKEAFKPYKYLLTIGVAAGKTSIDAAYEIKKIAEYVVYSLCGFVD